MIRIAFSEQYHSSVLIVHQSQPLSVDDIIEHCMSIGAVRDEDPGGPEYVVEVRPEVGPELWTESALRRTFTEGTK